MLNLLLISTDSDIEEHFKKLPFAFPELYNQVQIFSSINELTRNSTLLSPDCIVVDSYIFNLNSNEGNFMKAKFSDSIIFSIKKSVSYKNTHYYCLKADCTDYKILSDCTSELNYYIQNLLQKAIYTKEHMIIVYCIFANPILSLDCTMHPNVYEIPNQLLAKYIANHFPVCEFFCLDGSFSNEKIIHLPRIPSTVLSKQLTSLLTDFITISHEFVTMFYTEFQSPHVPTDINWCRNRAMQNMILGHSSCTNTPIPLPPFCKNMVTKSADFSLLIQQEQLDLLHSSILQMIYEWKQESLPFLVLRENLSFLFNYLRSVFPLLNDFSYSADYLIDYLISFSLNDTKFAENIYQAIIHLFSTVPQDSLFATHEIQVRQIVSYLKSNLSHPMSLDILAYEMKMSKAYICRIFKKQMNVSPMDYFNQLKIDHAKALLALEPPLSIKKISEYLGYDDTYYFSKVFKKSTGYSPSQYRNS